MTVSPACSVPACGNAIATQLDAQSLCREHFIGVCYSRLEQASDLLRRPVTDTENDSLRDFLQECVERVTVLAHTRNDLQNIERAQLLDIALWASDLGRRIRRSSRRRASIPVRISSVGVVQSWQEDTRTLVISQHGASLFTSRPVRIGERIEIARRDTERCGVARVVWACPQRSGGVEIGIEMLDSNNFWD